MNINNDTLLQGDVEISPWTSLAQHVGRVAAYAVQIKCLSGSITAKLQCSLDKGEEMSTSEDGQSVKVQKWTDIAGASQVLAAGDDVTFDASELGYNWMRVVVTGSGIIESARINKKGF
jgi:hypothetical protein